MKIINKRKKGDKMVKIIIGSSEVGQTKIKAPTKSISLLETDVEEVYNKLIKFLEELENGK